MSMARSDGHVLGAPTVVMAVLEGMKGYLSARAASVTSSSTFPVTVKLGSS
jgi:hypothetical protein